MDVRPVSFRSDGNLLVGDLYMPAGDGRHPAVVVTGPISNVRSQVPATYASRFADRGYAALAFDHRTWGDSEGSPRQHESTPARVADLRDAVSFLSTTTNIDPRHLAVCGVCLGAVAATQLAAFDPRVRVAALIAGSYNDPATLRQRFGPEQYDDLMRQFSKIEQQQFETGEVVYWPAADAKGMPAAMPGPEPWEYYGTSRGQRAGWENRCTALSVKEELTMTALPALRVMTTPLLVVHGTGDQAVPIDDARAAAAAAIGPTDLVLVDANNHIDLYDVETLVDAAVDATVAWFDQHLSGSE
jgi:fermentation-respiration switch protein FrsA (DUF1100 family)